MKIIEIGLIALLLFLLQIFVYKKFWDKNIKVSVSFKQAGISEGEEGEIIEVIENRKWLYLPMLKVKFQTSRYIQFSDDAGSKTTDQYYRNDIFQVGSNEKITRKLTFTGGKRGYYQIKNIDLVSSDLFFFSENIKHIVTECYLYVYPRVFSNKKFHLSLQKLNGEIQVKRHLLEDPFTYRGIREYQIGDDMRSVNWKASARTGALKVNQKGYSAMQNIRIFLNLEDDGILKKEKEIEATMQIGMGIVSFFLSQGIKVSCYANGRDILTDEHMEMEGGAGKGQLDSIGKTLARIDTEKQAYSFCKLFQEKILNDSEGMFTFFVSPNGYDDFLKLLELCSKKRMDFCWYCPVTQEWRSEQGVEKAVLLKLE